MSETTESASGLLSHRVLEAMSAAAYRTQSKRRWQYKHVSPSIEKITGYRPDEFKKGEVAVKSIMDQDQFPAIQRACKDQISATDTYSVEFRIICRDKSVRWIQDIGVVSRDAEGKPERYEGLLIDNSEKRQLIFRSRLGERALKSEGLFKQRAINILSHELRTPLNAIFGFSQVLDASVQMGDAERFQRDAEKYLAHIIDSSTLLKRLIDDTLASLAENRLAPYAADTPFSALEAARFGRSVHDAAAGAVSDVAIDRESLDPVVILGSRASFVQVVASIISNTVKHGGGAARLAISAAGDEQGALLILFDDDGPGVPDPHLADIFFPFRKQKDQENFGASGLGAGLNLVRDVAMRFEGDLFAGASPQGGLRIALRIPPHRAYDSPEPLDARPVTAGCQRVS